MPFLPLRFLVLLLAFAFLVGFVQFGIIRIAFDRLGLSAESAFLLFICTLVGSFVNLPLFKLKSEASALSSEQPSWQSNWPFLNRPPFRGSTVLSINIGGAVVPVAFSIYLITHCPLSLFQLVAAVTVVAVAAYSVSRPIHGIGIGIPALIAPLVAALVATLLDPEQRAPLAYIGGTLGVLIGADLFRLKDIRTLGSPIAVIGGAGSFDGVFITGLIAVLLAQQRLHSALDQFLFPGMTLWSVHMRAGWRRRRNHHTGIGLLLMMALLVMTAIGIYYFGDERLSLYSSIGHMGVSALLIVLLLVHMVIGWRKYHAGMMVHKERTQPG